MNRFHIPFSHTVGYLFLSRLFGVGNGKWQEALALRPSLEEVCSMTDAEWKESGLLSVAESRRLTRIDGDTLQDTITYCQEHNIRILTPKDEEYPKRLLAMENPPAVLFARGLPLAQTDPTIGVVGARQCTEFGQKAAYSLAANLALAGFTVVSGGAIGIDNMAHIGALNAGGKTIVVLGSGLDSNYLMRQEPLRQRAAQHGTLLSEFEPKTSATRYTFPIRNRLIAGLSVGVAVIEAGQKSGALITATYAMEQGKEVFALPGTINQSQYIGTNELLRDGAIPLLAVEDILSVYIGRFPDTLKTSVRLTEEIKRGYRVEAARQENRTAAKKSPPVCRVESPPIIGGSVAPWDIKASSNAKKVYAAFQEEIEFSDTLRERSGLSGGPFIAAVTELELYGYIKAVPVGRYQKCK